MAFIKRKSEFIGVGALIQLLGLILIVAFIFFPFSTIGGIILFVIGSKMSLKYVCSDCKNKVEKDSKICPVCKIKFEEK